MTEPIRAAAVVDASSAYGVADLGSDSPLTPTTSDRPAGDA
jgi:hypothetical protein